MNDQPDARKSDDETLRKLWNRFAEAPCCWLSSVRPGSRAHCVPVWHVCHQGLVCVVTMSTSVKVANIIVNPGVVVSHPDPMNTVIIEGKARLATRLRGKLRPLFKEKYDWELDESPDYDAILAITPTKLMAWGKHGEGRWSGRRLREVKRFE